MRRGRLLRANGTSLLARLRGESGFGLIELLVAMLVTSIAIMALVAALSSSHVSIVRASRISTGAALASKQLETYRAVRYSAITIQAATTVNETGADGRLYPVTTTITATCPNGTAPTGSPAACSGTGRPIKSVLVEVREPTTNALLVRQTSVFDEATGL